MNTSNTNFPNEMWMRVFAYCDGQSLRAVILTCRRFRTLGMEELLRTLVWQSKKKAEQNLEFWEDAVDRRYIPTSLSMKFSRRIDSCPDILNHISWFHNLRTLSLSGGGLPTIFYWVLLSLQQLTHLSLASCELPHPPAHFPLSYPSFSDVTAESPEIRITDLSVRNVLGYFGEPLPVQELLEFLPHLRALTTDYTYIHPSEPILPQLTSFTLLPSSSSPEFMVMWMNTCLGHTKNLRHLTIGVPTALTMRDAPPPVDASLPFLETFTGPAFVADGILDGAPALLALTINTVFKKTEEALSIIERVNHAATLRAIDLKLVEWDDEVLLAVAHRLPTCRSVKVSFRFSEPTEEFLFNLGVEHLPLLDQLHTLHVLARGHKAPQVTQQNDQDDSGVPSIHAPLTYAHPSAYHAHALRAPREADEEPPRPDAAPPPEEQCVEHLAAWTRYNKNLRNVRFARGREWVRQFIGGRWSVGTVS
ncbi:hypothetical protein C8R43DRAFT_1020511 [Mycena crocata]|nr:hypothetical protein C8R43DRAFT_1020511 [Mycena crocata]